MKGRLVGLFIRFGTLLFVMSMWIVNKGKQRLNVIERKS